MVLRRVECGEQNNRATSECLLMKYMLRFSGLLGSGKRENSCVLQKQGSQKTSLKDWLYRIVCLLRFPLSLNNPALTKGSENTLEV